MANFLVTDDLLDHMNSLPDWYVQVLEERETNECDTCPDNWIEITLEDMQGRPVSGEAYFVFTENTDGSAIISQNPEGGPFTNGAGQTIPTRLALSEAAPVVDIAYGADTVRTRNLTDENLGEDYDEQLYLMDTPVTYDGPLSLPQNVSDAPLEAYRKVLEVAQAYDARVPEEALQDMLAEIDTALRAALGVFSDFSYTPRNANEVALHLGAQLLWPGVFALPDIQPYYPEGPDGVASTFAHRVEYGLGIFVGPDGACYEDPHLSHWSSRPSRGSGIMQQMLDWNTAYYMLDQLQAYSQYYSLWAQRLPSIEQIRQQSEASLNIDPRIIPARGGPPRPMRSQLRGGRWGGPRRGKGNNPRQRAVGRNGLQAHTQLHTRRPTKTEKGVKLSTPGRGRFDSELRVHVDTGHGMKGTTSSGGHRYSSQIQQLNNSGRRFEIREAARPNRSDPNWRGYEYRVQRSDGTWTNWKVKTLYTDNVPYGVVLRQGKEAFRNFMTQNPGFRGGRWEGVTRNGLRMEGFSTMQGRFNFRITSFFAKKWW